jgi:hypothetical protein
MYKGVWEMIKQILRLLFLLAMYELGKYVTEQVYIFNLRLVPLFRFFFTLCLNNCKPLIALSFSYVCMLVEAESKEEAKERYEAQVKRGAVIKVGQLFENIRVCVYACVLLNL